MISHFLSLEWKQYFRSSHWQKGISIKIIMTLFALYFVLSFLAIGVGGYFFLKKEFPDEDPLVIVNTYLLYFFLGDLVIRYLMQKLPVMNIKPMLILPIKKSKLVHYVLGKSIFSAFNIIALFFFVPFAIVLMNQGYDILGVCAWLFFIILLIQSNNFLNFLINKNNVAFAIIASVLVGLVALQKFEIFNITNYGGSFFSAIYSTPVYLSLIHI